MNKGTSGLSFGRQIFNLGRNAFDVHCGTTDGANSPWPSSFRVASMSGRTRISTSANYFDVGARSTVESALRGGPPWHFVVAMVPFANQLARSQ